MRLAWMSDIHLDFVSSVARRSFLDSVKEQADVLVICGDIGDGRNIFEMLNQIDTLFDKPTYFVLGNHDFYHSSIRQTRSLVEQFVASTQNLRYLSNFPSVELSPTTVLVGHDGWGDGRFGDLDGSDVILNDFSLIKELHCWRKNELNKPALRKVIAKLGDEAAQHLRRVLIPAICYPNVFVATHVPPFREAAWHEGHQSDNNFLPYFACKAVGDVLLDVATTHPECTITVLCGHTHSGGEVNITKNLRVITAPEEYGKPRIQHVFNIE